MEIGEIFFYTGIGIGNLLIAIEWAKKGFWEVGLEGPKNKRVILGLCVGAGTIFIGGIAHRATGFNPTNIYAIIAVLLFPLLTVFVIRALMPPGQRKFDVAKTRTIFWVATRYEAGRAIKRGDELREFPLAQGTIRMFKEAMASYETDYSFRGRKNVGVGYIELGMLYRIMNMWEEACQSLSHGLSVLRDLERDYPNNRGLKADLSLALFRLAETNHTIGRFDDAVGHYEESHRLGKDSDLEEDIALTNTLLYRARKHTN